MLPEQSKELILNNDDMKQVKVWWAAVKADAKDIEGTPSAQADLKELKESAIAVANDFKPLAKDLAVELLKLL